MTLRKFKSFMLFWAICFLVVGAYFVFLPNQVIDTLNHAARFLKMGGPISLTQDYLWLSLAGSMMMTISYLSYALFQAPKNHHLMNALLVSKCMSSCFFSFFALKINSTYWLGTLVDFPIFILFLWTFRKIRT